MPNIDNLRKYNHIHMRGIGGVSMSGIAEILHNWGFTVTGSDDNASENTDKLLKTGIPVVIGYDFEGLKNSDVLVYTAAMHSDDPELVKARQLNIPLIERADFLGEITKCYKNTIAVSGTHGKTTTTSMISLCFLEAFKDPSIQVGAILRQIDGNYRVGNSDYFIIEACEYVESFLKFHPKSEIVLNIDNDHLDYFKTFDNIKSAFAKYAKLLPEEGLLVVNGDDPNCVELKRFTLAKFVTYGIENQHANFVARNITFDDEGFASFDVYYNNNFYKTIKLSVAGKHNVYNALACIALCHEYGISKEDMKVALAKFTGAHRRLELLGNFNNIKVYDDYGHHPTEIIATANAIKNKHYHESWVVFQPHTYSRTKKLLDDFANALTNFDHIIVTDIYAARESNTYGVSSKDLVEQVCQLGKNAKYISDFDEIVSYLKQNAKQNDIILTLGAGTVTNIGPMLLKE